MLTFDKEPKKTASRVNATDLDVVISTGPVCFDILVTRIQNKSFALPANVLLLSFAPQIEILQRAALFVTHMGMNSASEAIHYGVPVIGIPITFDQPLVAIRMCDELNFGKRFDYVKFRPKELRSAIHEIFRNSVYLENVIKYAKLSRENNGVLNAAGLIINYINE